MQVLKGRGSRIKNKANEGTTCSFISNMARDLEVEQGSLEREEKTVKPQKRLFVINFLCSLSDHESYSVLFLKGIFKTNKFGQLVKKGQADVMSNMHTQLWQSVNTEDLDLN